MKPSCHWRCETVVWVHWTVGGKVRGLQCSAARGEFHPLSSQELLSHRKPQLNTGSADNQASASFLSVSAWMKTRVRASRHWRLLDSRTVRLMSCHVFSCFGGFFCCLFVCFLRSARSLHFVSTKIVNFLVVISHNQTTSALTQEAAAESASSSVNEAKRSLYWNSY